MSIAQGLHMPTCQSPGDSSLLMTIPTNYEHTPSAITPRISFTGCTVVLRGAGGEMEDLAFDYLFLLVCEEVSCEHWDNRTI